MVSRPKDNTFLKKLRLHQSSRRIGCTSVGISTVMDDNFMLSTLLNPTQTQLLLAQYNAEKIKTSAQKVRKKKNPVKFNNGKIDYSVKETQPGTQQNNGLEAHRSHKRQDPNWKKNNIQHKGIGIYSVCDM